MTHISILTKLAFSTPILLIQILLSFFFKIKIGKLDTSRIGNMYVADLYLIKKKIKKINQLEVWVTDRKICNIQMYKMLDHNFKILNFLKFYYDSLNFLSIKINFFSKYITRLDLDKDFIYHNKLGTQMKLSKRDYKKAKILAKNFNIPKKSKIICIACRDSAYLKNSNLGSDFSYHNYRDTNINSFVPLIKKLIKKKYFVIRVGKTSKTRVKIKSKYFLDYPFSKYKNDLLDFYFPKICNLWVGSNTGLDCLAIMLQKPIVLINLSPAGVILHNIKNKKAIYHLKTYHLNNKKIPFKEIFNKNLHNIGKTEIFQRKKIKLQSASAKEIIELCNEGINFFLNKKKFVINDVKNQNKYKKLLSILLKRKKNSFNSFLSPIFLKKNKWLLR